MFGFLRRREHKGDDMIRRADALRDTGRFVEAAEAFATAIRFAPHRFDLIVQQANMLKDAGRLDEAAATYGRALEVLPGDADIHLQLGHLARLRRDFDGARNAYRDALACKPPSLFALNELRAVGDSDGIARHLSPETAFNLLSGGSRAEIALPPTFWSSIRRAWEVPAPPPATASLRIMRIDETGVPGSHILLLSPGAKLHPQALDWFAYAASLAPDRGWIADSEIHDADGSPRLPILRDKPDAFAMAHDHQVLGALVVPMATLHARRADDMEDIAFDLVRKGLLSHIPLPLTAFDGMPGKSGLSAAPAPETEGHIGVVIPTRDGGADVVGFIKSLRETAHSPDEITILVVDNGSNDPATVNHLANLEATARTRVLRIDEPFNWSRLNNTAAETLQTDILLFANDDMLMLSPGWDGVLRQRLADPAVGAVGARLLYPDGHVQHAGMLAGWNGELVHDGLAAESGDPGFGRAWITPHAASAVTGAFLAVRRADFQRIEGFDEARFAISFGDVDLCYRLRAEGLTVLYEPAIVAEHFESKTRGRDDATPAQAARHAAERAAFVARWGEQNADEWLNPWWVQTGQPRRFLAAVDQCTILRRIAKQVGRRAVESM